MNNIPKIIWMYWHQGLENAPHMVQHCVKSWKHMNPEWEVKVIDKDNISKYVNIELKKEKFENMVLAHYSDLLRAKLLYTYGGVWADATSYCMKPLDTWLKPYTVSGFFALTRLSSTGLIGLMSNWFLVSEKNSIIMKKTYEIKLNYWNENKLNNKGKIKRYIRKWAGKLLNHKMSTIKYWFHPIITKILKIHPYYVFHYIFNDLVNHNDACKKIWDNVERINDEPHHTVKRAGLTNPLTPNVKKAIDDKEIPIFKLSWKKYDHEKYTKDSTLYYLFEGRFQNK